MEKIEERRYPTWDNDLIMCPSQCYCYFETDGKKYCIYLRWRWDDPWTAQIVPVDNRCDFLYELEWEYVETKFYSHDDYEKLQESASRLSRKSLMMLNGWLKNTTDMETKFNFNSSVCTDRSQSERLLALGLRKETADVTAHYEYGVATIIGMDYPYYVQLHTELGHTDKFFENIFPAWSLCRLLRLVSYDMEINIFLLRSCFKIFNHKPVRVDSDGALFDGLIDYIEWTIKEGYFPKEYLEE